MRLTGLLKSCTLAFKGGLWICLLLIAPHISWAVGTPSGTTISNSATLTYAIGAGPATTATSSTVSFVVDKKVNLLVSEVSGSATAVSIGQTGAVTTFSVTNLGNDPQGFTLAAALAVGDPATGGTPPFTTNNFSATGLQVFVDSNSNGIYEAGIDTATSIPNLAAGASQTVFIVGDIPATALSGQQSVVSLTATAVVPATMAPLLATAGPDTPGVDVVFADSAGVADGAHDAKYSAYDAYLVNGVNVVVTKTVPIVLDPTGTTPNGVLMSGSVMTYQIEVDLSGSGTATNLVITDPLPANLTYLANSITITCDSGTYAGGGACGVGTISTPQPPATKGDINTDGDYADFNFTTANAVTVTLGNVTSPAKSFIKFKATIN
jgi:uncharacterized repeat protein (TIGR01451 family)